MSIEPPVPAPQDTSEARKAHVREVFRKAQVAVQDGKITVQERDALLHSYYNTSNEQEVLDAIDRIAQTTAEEIDEGSAAPFKAYALIAAFVLVMAGLLGYLFLFTSGITGAVVIEQPIETTYTQTSTLELNFTNATRLNVTGTVVGLGNARITLELDDETKEIFAYNHGDVSTAHASLPKSWYIEGEPVTYLAIDVSNAYLMTLSQATPLESTTIENLTPGEYTLTLIINDSSVDSTGELSQESLPFRVVAAGTPEPTETFNTCGEACQLEASGEATLRIEIDGNATVTIDDIITTTGNDAPRLATNIADVNATGAAVIGLMSVFVDDDGDTLSYDIGHQEGNTEIIEEGILTINGPPGAYTYIAYASDGRDVTPSNIFLVTLTGEPSSVPMPEQNETANATNETQPDEQLPTHETAQEVTNATINVSTNLTASETAANNTASNETATNETALTVPDVVVPTDACADPDPNNRPLECLQGAEWFQDQTILITTNDRTPTARITPIGNLLLRGGVVLETPPLQPREGDYTISYEDEFGIQHVTVWFDSVTGNLRIIGELREENANLEPAPGSFVMRNRKGIVLLWANAGSGDVYIRGNVIPFRGDIMK